MTSGFRGHSDGAVWGSGAGEILVFRTRDTVTNEHNCLPGGTCIIWEFRRFAGPTVACRPQGLEKSGR